MAQFKESEHPRDKEGRFTDKELKGMSAKELSDKLKIDIGDKNKLKIKQLPYLESKEKAIYQIIQYTDYNAQKAEEVYDAIQFYTKAGYGHIRKNKTCKEALLIEDFIEKHPKYDGEIYRGMGLENLKGVAYLEYLELSKNRQTTIDMDGISSWSSEERIAEAFADERNKADDSYRFIFETNNISGVGISHLSNWVGENEVIHSSKTKYHVSEIKQIETGKSPLYKIILKEV